MIDFRKVDEMFDAGQRVGDAPPLFGIFDKRLLLPLDDLATCVTNETSEQVAPEQLLDFQEQGLFPVLPRVDDPAQLGFPLYTPSRIGLLLLLQRRGWTLEELKRVAELEEMMIDCVLTTDELEYTDDDHALVLRNVEAEVEKCDEMVAFLDAGPPPNTPPPMYAPGVSSEEMRARADRLRRYAERLRAAGTLTEKARDTLARNAFRTRARDEMIRVMLLEQDRAVARAGCSPWIVFQQQKFDAHNGFSFSGIMWPWTLREPNVGEGDRSLPIRLPRMILRDDEVTLIGPHIPRDYDRVWREYDLEQYFQVRANLLKERACQHCLKALPDDSSTTRLYCSDTCRSAAKMKRFRRNNPDKVVRINERYWSSDTSERE